MWVLGLATILFCGLTGICLLCSLGITCESSHHFQRHTTYKSWNLQNNALCLGFHYLGPLPLVPRKSWRMRTSSRHTHLQTYFLCSHLKARVALAGKPSKVTLTGPRAVKLRTPIFLPSPQVSFYHWRYCWKFLFRTVVLNQGHHILAAWAGDVFQERMGLIQKPLLHKGKMDRA